MAIEMKEGIEWREEKREKGKEGIMVRRVKLGEDWWRVVGIYVDKSVGKKVDEIKNWLEKKGKDSKTIVGGDFNARTGE